MMRFVYYAVSFVSLALVLIFAPTHPWAWWFLVLVAPYIGLGIFDLVQHDHALLRNYPVIGHGRYIMELVRPEIQQYFVESNIDGRPFHRNDRSIVYQRAKKAIETMPFGTQFDVYEHGYEWMNHSIHPAKKLPEEHRLVIGQKRCKQPYSASRFNISAMSYGSLSRRAILALNKGASQGGFYHNTGEGGLSPHHLHYGGDVVWQLGTGYFSARAADGGFDPEKFKVNATKPSVKMIEVKISQGAKPAHGGILPAAKCTPEIAEIRGVEPYKEVDSPPAHKAFSTPVGLLEFLESLREMSGGKPVGFKLCIGQPEEFVSIVKAMKVTGKLPDFITVDGSEGGTGAAPFEFSNSVGMPMRDGLAFAQNILVGAGLRDEVALIASGKVITGFHMFRAMALGADACNCARGMMFALGCIQARRCNMNDCPVGVATNDPKLDKAIHVEDKGDRVDCYHERTVDSFLELLAAAGLTDPGQIRPEHVFRRVDETRCLRYSELYEWLTPGCLTDGTAPTKWQMMWNQASIDQFCPSFEAIG
ncbi:MAG TPA: FMN-binding glutamate synthase family protein [Fimbriimonadaceae bacterium]|nr:FMN-binding glutamate synthase family protein [Fimbriimonadaceae bacterium]